MVRERWSSEDMRRAWQKCAQLLTDLLRFAIHTQLLRQGKRLLKPLTDLWLRCMAMPHQLQFGPGGERAGKLRRAGIYRRAIPGAGHGFRGDEVRLGKG